MYILQEQKVVKINSKDQEVWIDVKGLSLVDIIVMNRYLMNKKSKGKFRVLSLAQKPMIYDRT